MNYDLSTSPHVPNSYPIYHLHKKRNQTSECYSNLFSFIDR